MTYGISTTLETTFSMISKSPTYIHLQANAIAQLLLAFLTDNPFYFLIANPLSGLLIEDAESLHANP